MEAADAHAERNQQTFAELVRDETEFFRWQSEKVALIESVLRGLRPHGSLADVGCFTGLATAIFRATGFERAVGFDSCQEALDLAETRNIQPRVWSVDSGTCPAADSEFHVVVAADIIEHIVDTDAFLRELWRILDLDGFLIVTTPNLAFWISRLRLLAGKPPWSYPGPSSTVKGDLMVDLNHIRITTRREWEALFRVRSFEIVDVRGWSILQAKGDSIGVRIRRLIDRYATGFPDFACGLLFVLRKVKSVE